MSSVYPGALDTLATNKANATAQTTDHPAHHNDLADAVNKVEAELGVNPSGAAATVAARILSVENARARTGYEAVRDSVLAPVMGTPPTVLLGAADAATTITGSTVRSKSDLTKFRYLGANPADAGPSWPNSSYYTPNNITGANQGGQPWAVEFYTDADVFEIETKGQGGHYRLFVDGAPSTSGYVAGPAANGSLYKLKMTFASAAVRRIRLEMTWTFYFGGIGLHPTYGVWKPSHPKGPRCICIGDSFTEPTASSVLAYAYDGMVQVAAKLLGWDDLWASGYGGSGINTSPTFASRVAADVIAYSPEVVLIQDQDSATAAATQQTALSSLLATLTSGLPNARIVGIGNVALLTSQAGGAQTINTALRTTYEAAGALYVDPSAAGDVWIEGTGKSGATTGVGNSDFYTGTDEGHPTKAGHAYLGQRIAAVLSPYFPLAA